MKLKQAQSGVTLVTIAFFLLLLGFAVYTTLKLFPVYMENFTIKSSLENLEQDSAAEYNGAMAVRTAVVKHFGLNNVTQVKHDQVSVVREGELYLIDVDYEVRVPFMKNIDLAVSFTNHAEVRAR